MNTEAVNTLAAAGTFFTVIFSAIGVWFTWRTIRQDRARKLLEQEESKARLELALNLKAKTTVHEMGQHLFIETFVEIHNPSRKSWCIPAAYISYRALIDAASPVPFSGKEGFDNLPPCVGLRVTRNRAYLPRSIWIVGPDEKVRLSRIDRVDAEGFRQRYPVLWVNVEAFGGAYELLGRERTELNGYGKYRRDWIEFMTLLEAQDDTYIAIDRLDPFLPSPWTGFEPGDRCIVGNSGGTIQPDQSRSQQFRALLQPDSMSQWTIDTTVKIATAETAYEALESGYEV